MDNEDRKKIRQNLPDLAKSMNFVDVSMLLLSKEIFDIHHIQTFQSKSSTMLQNQAMLMSLETRGPKAFGALVEALVQDPAQVWLAEKLGYSLPSSATPLARASMPPEGKPGPRQPAGDVGDSSVFMETDKTVPYPSSMMDEEKVYKMTGRPRGIALIINNKNFTTKPRRPGSDVDCHNLRNAFKWLGFTVIVHEDLTSTVRDHDHWRYDCTIIAVLSHGERGAVYGTEGGLIKIEDIVSYFDEDQCPTLAGKPKLFFVQAPFMKRQGDDNEDAPDGRKVTTATDEPDASAATRNGTAKPDVQAEAAEPPSSLLSYHGATRDVLVAYSHLPGFFSVHQSDRGTMFVNAVIEVLQQHAREEDLLSMITLMHGEMDKTLKASVGRSLPIPPPITTLRKKLFFVPGFYGYFSSQQETSAPPSTTPDHELVYRMESKPRGMALIFNNRTFKKMATRKGSDVDCNALTGLFEWLGFDVVVHLDKKKHEMLDCLRECRRMDHSPYDCFILTLLTHGTKGAIYTSDDKELAVDEIVGCFGSDKCPTLAGKPKLFFLQACRGEKYDPGSDFTDKGTPGRDEEVKASSIPQEPCDEETLVKKMIDMELGDFTDSYRVYKVPTLSDMLLAYATVPGFVSWRNSERGSWFIQAIVDVFRKHAEREDILSLTTVINYKVAREFHSSSGQYKMIPAPVNMLTKKLFFFPDKRAELAGPHSGELFSSTV